MSRPKTWSPVLVAHLAGPTASAGSMQVFASSGLENEVVVGCAASRYFSLVVTAKGEVWTFGACYSGSLGSDLSWSTSAQVCRGWAATQEGWGGVYSQVSKLHWLVLALQLTLWPVALQLALV